MTGLFLPAICVIFMVNPDAWSYNGKTVVLWNLSEKGIGMKKVLPVLLVMMFISMVVAKDDKPSKKQGGL